MISVAVFFDDFEDKTYAFSFPKEKGLGPGRFELPSQPPEGRILPNYTKGPFAILG